MQGEIPGNNTMGLFAGGEPDLGFVAAAHELKNPLSLIRQLALTLEQGSMSAEQQRLLRQILLVSERSLRTVTGLTRSARLEDSLFELAPVNPLTVCEDVVRELTPLYEEQGRTLCVVQRSRPLLAVANEELLRRILLSFADNALRFCTPDYPVRLHASSFAGGAGVRLSVRDFGPHVSNRTMKTLRQHLGAAPQPLAARPESSGLGLYLAGQFARTMNGRIGMVRHHDGMSFYVDIAASTQLSLL